MTICPFMSSDNPEYPFIKCQREGCEAWKVVGGTNGAPEYGCRLIEGEVPE